MYRSFLLLVALAILPAVAGAQPLQVSVAAGGFSGPLGVQHDEARPWVWVAETGTGNDDGRVSVVTPDGTFPFMTGFRSVVAGDETQGLTQIRLDGDVLWIAQGLASLGESYLYAVSTAGFTPGDPPLSPGDADLTVDVGAFVLGQGFAETNPYDVAPSADGETVYLTDAAANAVLALDLGTNALSVVTTLADIPNPTTVGPPFVQAVPTGIVERDGVLYVGSLTGFPFVPGLARVYRVEGGTATVWRDGLTSVTDVAVDPEDGQIVAVEFAVFDLVNGFLPGTGRLVKLFDHGPRQVLADGLDLTPGVDIRGDAHAVTSLFGLLLDAEPAVDLDVTPDAPVTGSDPFDVTLALTNDTNAARTVTVRLFVVTAGGAQPRTERTVTLAAGQTFTRSVSLDPPAGASFRLAFLAQDAGGTVLDSDVVTVDRPLARGSGGTTLDDLDLSSWLDDVPAASATAPEATRLAGSYPNPFAQATTLAFEVAEAGPVRLAVYDALGREVAVLAEGAFEPGLHRARFDAAGLPAGVYLARLTAGGATRTHRMTLLR